MSPLSVGTVRDVKHWTVAEEVSLKNLDGITFFYRPKCYDVCDLPYLNYCSRARWKHHAAVYKCWHSVTRSIGKRSRETAAPRSYLKLGG